MKLLEEEKYTMIIGKTICVFIDTIQPHINSIETLSQETIYITTTLLSHLQYHEKYKGTKEQNELIEELIATVLFPLTLKSMENKKRLTISFGVLLHHKSLNMDMTPVLTTTREIEKWVDTHWALSGPVIISRIYKIYDVYKKLVENNKVIKIECPKLTEKLYERNPRKPTRKTVKNYLDKLHIFSKKLLRDENNIYYICKITMISYSLYIMIARTLVRLPFILDYKLKEKYDKKYSITYRTQTFYKLFTKNKEPRWTN